MAVQTTSEFGILKPLLDDLASRVAEKLGAQDEGFLTGAKQIGAYLGWSAERVENIRSDDPTFPAFRQGGRIMADKAELRAWVEAQRMTSPTGGGTA